LADRFNLVGFQIDRGEALRHVALHRSALNMRYAFRAFALVRQFIYTVKSHLLTGKYEIGCMGTYATVALSSRHSTQYIYSNFTLFETCGTINRLL
jgi:hypothetical protein